MWHSSHRSIYSVSLQTEPLKSYQVVCSTPLWTMTNALTDILLYHVVSGKAFSKDLEDGQRIKTIVGRTVKVDLRSDGDIEINDADVDHPDIKACNGVIHVIDRVLIPSIKDDGDCDEDDQCGFCVGKSAEERIA